MIVLKVHFDVGHFSKHSLLRFPNTVKYCEDFVEASEDKQQVEDPNADKVGRQNEWRMKKNKLTLSQGRQVITTKVIMHVPKVILYINNSQSGAYQQLAPAH